MRRRATTMVRASESPISTALARNPIVSKRTKLISMVILLSTYKVGYQLFALPCTGHRRDRARLDRGPVHVGGRRRAELRRHLTRTRTGLRMNWLVNPSRRHSLWSSIIHSEFVPFPPRAQRKPVPWVWSANPPRPRATVVRSAAGLCQEPPRMDRTTPFLLGPCGFRSGACR